MRDCLKQLNNLGNAVCVGLDPDLTKTPSEFDILNQEESILEFLEQIVAVTSEYAAAFKIQKAFLDLYAGPSLLERLIERIHKISNKPVIVDCKIGDIDNTMNAYLKNIFDRANADAIIINPYMGGDVINSTKRYSDRGIFVLVKTSNPSAGMIQNLMILPRNNNDTVKPLWKYLLSELICRFNDYRNIMPVLSYDSNLRDIRRLLPEDMSLLYAGVGIQGGNLDGIEYLFNSKKGGVIVNSSRHILYPYLRSDKNWRDKVLLTTRDLHEEIVKIRNNDRK